MSRALPVIQTYYSKHRDVILKRQKAWHKKRYENEPKYREEQNNRSKQRYQEHKAECLKYQTNWRATHPEKILEYRIKHNKAKKSKYPKPLAAKIRKVKVLKKAIKKIIVKKVVAKKSRAIMLFNTSSVLNNALSRITK